MRKPILATRCAPCVNNAVRKLANSMGVSISEYLRRLVLQDLDSRKMLDEELKKAVESPDEEDLLLRRNNKTFTVYSMED